MERRTISKEVYGRVISLIPQEIIDMLPENPEKLLPYATRTKEVQVTTGINDDVRDLMQEYLLSDEEYLKTFFYVMAITFYNKVPVENPEIAIVAAQTGSGKSNLTAKLLRKNDNYIFFECKSTVPYAKTRCLDENYIKQEIDKISNYVLQLSTFDSV